MKKLFAMLLAGLMLASVMSVCAFALENQAEITYSVSDGKVTLSWDKTDDDTYTVYWKRSSSSEWKVAGTTAKHKVNITGLKNGISYDFKVEISGTDSEVVTATPVESIFDVIIWDFGTFVVTADTEVYSGVLNGEVLGILEAGETVEAKGKVYINDSSLYAYMISYNGKDAYVDKDALTDPDFDVEPNEIDYEDLADRKYFTYDNIGEVEICVVPDSITSTSATFKVRNSSEYLVTHGEDFRLQVYSDDGWSDVEFIVDSHDVEAIAWLVYGGGNISTFKANWSYFYGELPAGHYRFVLEYTYQTDDGAVNVYGVCGFDIE